jgi:hypothetical protein
VPFWTCEQCGAQFPESRQPPPCCPVCEDDRQFVNWRGQRWLSRDELARKVTGSAGVRIAALSGSASNLRCDRPARAVDSGWRRLRDVGLRAARHRRGGRCVKSLGGLRAIAVSHPHYYGAITDWSEAFGSIGLSASR